MVKFRGQRDAFGWPGCDPRWARGNLDGVGAAYSADSRVWFNLWRGTLSQIYYPLVDRPQTRDLQYLITDGKTFFHEEKRHLEPTVKRISDHVLGYTITSQDPQKRYKIDKQIIADPHLTCILQRTRLQILNSSVQQLKIFVLCAPHLEGGGKNNNAYIIVHEGREILAAEKGGAWLAVAATVPFTHLSCGFVGRSDGWTDLMDNKRMDWEFDRALNGNVALTGELDISETQEFTLATAFGDSLQNVLTTLFTSLSLPFDNHLERYVNQWNRPSNKILPLHPSSQDKGNLYHGSYSLILAHEDKSYPGAIIASLSIPWGEAMGDEERGGYHLVWTRDLVNSAMGLLAAGNNFTPLRALVYLSVSQQEDGGFAQNFWLDGEPYWTGIQLDETSFPVMLAWRLHETDALRDFDPYPMVMRALNFIIRKGPATQQERWEELSGYSPSTLAANIAALICGANFARTRKDEATAQFLEDYADFLDCHLEHWTVTTEGTLLPEVKRHFFRIHPIDLGDPQSEEDPNKGILVLPNQPPGEQKEYPAKEIVDAGFLELVRYGVRSADDPLIIDSLRVVDKVLKVDTPYGPCWHRYNHDGYGQHDDGGPYHGWGKGRAWPLLTGERGHYELAAGHDAKPFIKALERFSQPAGLIPEQIWDEKTQKHHMKIGRPTGSATPLLWAHAEYIKLLRSTSDGKVFDLIPAVADRYIKNRAKCKHLEIWKQNRQPLTMWKGYTLRVQAHDPFILHWSSDGWKSIQDTKSSSTSLGVEFVDIPTTQDQQGSIKFTFLWTKSNTWEGRDYEVTIE
ncbi:MAG: glycoside hydrolase family 15 protein [Thaumarchaeota archaeon]|nr:glycoside hydrolase family 15 protein [Nitrososphaerota archaeon]MCL5317406.1 glycoside hydrolase family 15 protein [Nitrososphaerota archaeon]